MSSDFCIRCDNALSVYCGQCVDAIRKELDESRAAFLAAAQAICIVYEAEGHAPAPGPVETVVEAIRDAARAKGRLIEVEMKLEQLQWGNEMACENTPHPACSCPGCETARDRARRGVAGPEDEP